MNLQRELFEKNTELERVSAEKTQFLGMAAHDLRNPLNVIMGYSEFLLEDAAPVLNAEQLEFVTDIRSASEAMLRLITDLVDITAIEAGRLDLHVADTDLAAMVRRSVHRHARMAARKDISIELLACPPAGLFPLDPVRIDEVLDNLLSNATKYSPRGSTVGVRLEYGENRAVLSVQDEGAGIPPSELEKLFRPFSRTSVKTTAGEQSTGLGLAIVRKIVAAHGGTVEVDSELGRGSTFTVRLPLRPEVS